MKLPEMADLLNGLATTFENHLTKTPMNDLRALSECLRLFPDDTVAGFAKFVSEAKAGKPSRPARKGSLPEERIEALVQRVKNFRDHHKTLAYQDGRQIAAEIGKLTVSGIRAVGDRAGCPVSGTKAQMVSRLENWLLNLKQSADQASFSLSARVG